MPRLDDRGREHPRLATLVRMIATADAGKNEEAIASLRGLLKVPAELKGKEPAAEVEAKLAVVEAYVRRLIRRGRYDRARELCSMICEEDTAPDVLKDHFEGRMDRLDLLNKPAPTIEGTDVEGKKVSLAGLKGKVVLVDFWATWCPPCVASIPTLKRLEATYRDRGFAILGINLDARHEAAGEVGKSLPLVRKFLAEHEAAWTNLLDAEGAGDFARAYGVEEIPANFLVGRDGKIVALELGVDCAGVGDLAGGRRGEVRIMSKKHVLLISAFTLSLILPPTGQSWSRTQSGGGFGGYGTTPYNYNYGGGAGALGGFGGFGSTPYLYSHSYGVTTGQPGAASQATGNLYQQLPRPSVPQVSESFQPVYNIITTETDWNRPRRVTRRRRGPNVPREQLLDDQGKILWPAVTPDGPAVSDARRDAEAAVRSVVDEGKRGRSCLDPACHRREGEAHRLLAATALPDLKASDAARRG